MFQQVKVQRVLQLMMNLKFSQNAKVTRALTGQSPARPVPVADEVFEISWTGSPIKVSWSLDFLIYSWYFAEENFIQ